jgi:diguanylate cyclase (GGDEF)-like protein
MAKRLMPYLIVAMAMLLALAPANATDSMTPARTWGRWHAADFEHLTVERGLPHPTTTALAQDRAGLVWIGTIGGLARFDGYRTQVFRQDDNWGSLPDNYVRTLAAADDGSLMVGTNSGGLTRFDPRTNRFNAIDSSTVTGTGPRVFGLSSDRAGGFWVASQDGLSHLHGDLKTLDASDPALNAQLKADSKTFAVLQDSRNNVWVGTNNGLFWRPHGASAFVRFATGDGVGAATLANDIWAIHEDRAGRVWFGSGSTGVVYLDREERMHAPPELAGDSAQIQRRTVRDIADLPDGTLWIATDGAGVVSYDAARDTAATLRHSRAEAASIGGNIVRALLVDRSDGVWAATETGASRHDTRTPSVYTLDGSVLFANEHGGGQADENVRSIYTDDDGIVWLGFNQGRMVSIDPASGAIRQLTLTGAQDGQDVKAIAALPDGQLIAGARGLVTVDPHTLQTRPYPSAPLDQRPILSLCACQGSLLVGTYDGLYRLHDNHGVELFRHLPSDPGSITGNQVRNLVLMPDGNVWAATTDGISVLKPGATRFENIQNVASVDNSLPQDYVGSIVSADGRIWVGTSGGIGSTPATAGTAARAFASITQKDGLGSDNVASLLADRRGRIWAATANGLTVYDPVTHTAVPLGLRDGYRTRFFNHRTATLGPRGELLFGGIGGLTIVDADADTQGAEVSATLAVTALTVDEQEIPFSHLPSHEAPLAVDAGTRSLRVAFALLDYAATNDMRYSYRLDGFDPRWVTIEAGVPPTAVYTNLPGGDYTLRLRVAITGLHAQTIESAIPVRVQARGFERTGSRIALLLALLVLIYALVRVRTGYLRRRASHLSALVDSRTADLRAANDRLDHLANVDELTGLANRRAIMNVLDCESQISERHGTPLSLVMLDLDKFKVLNDLHGHLAGDTVLRAVADTIVATCRPGDHAGRYGGEEIMLVLPRTADDGATQVAERCRVAVQALTIPFGDSLLTLTTSAGVASLRRGETIAALLARADEALYRAKRAGRNTLERAEH